MRVLIDTNIMLDVLLKRTQFFEDSFNALDKLLADGDSLYFSSSSITDVYYIIRRLTKNKEIALQGIKDILTLVRCADVSEGAILKALSSNLNDFEDAMIEGVASDVNADYILTRNIDDFFYSEVTAISPREMVNQK